VIERLFVSEGREGNNICLKGSEENEEGCTVEQSRDYWSSESPVFVTRHFGASNFDK
jgi:hypothetical protein